MEYKIGLGEVKELSEKGEGAAVIATLNVIDKDGDVTVPGAFGDQMVSMVPAHDWRAAPIGKARVYEIGDKAIADFRLNLKTQGGLDWYSALRFDLDHPPAKQQYSYGFTPVETANGEFDERQVRFLKQLEVHEVSPVLLGAGVDTGTLGLKERKAATPRHSTATDTGVWDGPANERRVEAGPGLTRNGPKIYAWRDPDGDPETKAAWKFIHHFVGGDGSPGAASMRACSLGIGILNGARGGTVIPTADRAGVHRHLAGHMTDGDMEPPELREADEEVSVKLADEIGWLLWDVEATLARVEEVRGLRAKDCRDIAAARKGQLAEMDRLLKTLDAMLREPSLEAGAVGATLKFLQLRKKRLDMMAGA